ncbi:MAG: VWA domain-containing protein [Dehalococcoidia bacterium]|nr:VWA domain-containing protein [Dehalococcoidia bacterium]MYA52528.1 VWA domain-containing protein [Dehalococcoidia bacterium]
MNFAEPWLLLLALLAAPLVLARWRRPAPVIAVPFALGLAGAPATWRVHARRLLPVLRVLAILLLVVGLARPRLGEAEALVPAEGVDIALAVDVSSSMSSSAFTQGFSRLDSVKDVIRDFVASRDNDRIGLVVFQQEALPLVPLTLDHEALDAIIADLGSDLLPNGTGIGVGIASALTMLEESSASSRIVILLTDGRHNVDSISPEEAAEIAAALRIRVYTIGVVEGDERPSGFSTTTIDAERLTAIAEHTGARYFEASTPEDLAQVYDEIASLETSRVGGESFARHTELGLWLVAAGALLLLGEVGLGRTWLRRTPA